MDIKQERTKKGYTQVDLARRLGVSVNSVRMWEQGGMNPSPENQLKLDLLFKSKTGGENE